ncbi:MAG: hypothetical protein RLW62_18480, partial [Gammaproteobacteria bacterium]
MHAEHHAARRGQRCGEDAIGVQFARGGDISGLVGLYDAAASELDTDRILAAALSASGRVVLGMQFVPGVP